MANYADILRSEVDALDAEADALVAELDTLAPDEQRSAEVVETRANEISARAAEIRTARAAKVARIAELDALRAERAAVPKAPNFIPSAPKAEDVAFDRSASPQQLRDGLLRSVSDRDMDDTQLRMLTKRHRNDTAWQRNLLARSSDVYADAFQKFMLGRESMWTNEERAAVAVGTSTQGGLLVPTHLDPSIMLTNDGSANALRAISRVVTLTTGNQWNGITSAGVTASWDAELSEVSDDSPTVAAAAVPTYMGRALIQASYQAFEDIDGLASDAMMLFADAKDRLEGAAHCTGSGSAEPTGIFTALGTGIASTTAATIGLVDLQGMKNALGQRFRNRATWVMNPTWADAIKNLGTSLSNTYSTDITQANTATLLGRPVVETDDAPEVVTTTVLDDRIVLGDFGSSYLIVDKPGSMAVEFIPNMFSDTTTLPNSVRAWMLHWRHGADSVNDSAFKLLQDKTSA
jgi:HK97 family phage major capsid protein